MCKTTSNTAAILLCSLSAGLCGCSDIGHMPAPERDNTRIEIVPALQTPGSRSADPDEDKVSDLNIFIFNQHGVLEESCYSNISGFRSENGAYIHETSLLRGCRYSIYVCANAGYRIPATSMDELLSYRYHLVYPDDYRIGIPMSGKSEGTVISDDGHISISLDRAMSKISLSIDRSRLSDNVEFTVRKISIGGCPKSVLLFRESRAESEDDIFLHGFSKEDDAVARLNYDEGFGRSGKTSVYMLENMQGDLLAADTPDNEKILADNDPKARVCSYIEIEADYSSDRYYTRPGESLVYRFYLGEDNGNFDVRRNCHYNVCIAPYDDGLREDSWRVDKSAIAEYVDEIELSYSSLRMTYEGETAVLKAYMIPEDAKADLVWETDNPAVARVSSDGTVTALSEGRCTIRCYASDGGGAYAECTVDVGFSPYYIRLYPGNFIRGKAGEKIHVWCEYFPPSASFDIGLDYLEFDKERGIYDYEIDADGRGAVLSLKKNGSGLLFMEAGYPLNQSEMVVIEVG